MLRLRSHILTHLLSPPSISSPIPSPLHRLLSAAVSPNPSFDVEGYLVATCGLTRAQALKAFPKLSHLKSPSKPDAVLAFLADLDIDLSSAAIVAKDPLFLCASVEGTLSPNLVELTSLGLSRSELARLVSVSPRAFRCRSVVSNLPYHLSLLGSYGNLLRALKQCTGLLGHSLEKVVKPNVSFLQHECGIGARGIASLCLAVPRFIGSKPEHVRETARRAQALGVPRGSGMFRLALQALASRGEENIALKLEHLKNTLRCSDAEAGIAVGKFPMLLTLSKETLQRKSQFLISHVGLQPAYILRRPEILSFGLESRLRPRYYVLKFLKENGLLHPDRGYYVPVTLTEEAFMEKFICPHKEAAPYLAQDYAAALRGEMTTRFRFT